MPEGEEIPPFNSFMKKEDFKDIINEKLMTIGISVYEHPHKLVFCLTNYDWKCDVCKKNYRKTEPSHFCSLCDYNMCDKCRKEKNYDHSSTFPEIIIPPNENMNKFVESPLHHHRLAYARYTKTFINLASYDCSLCELRYESDIWPLYCTLCNFKLCYKCAGI